MLGDSGAELFAINSNMQFWYKCDISDSEKEKLYFRAVQALSLHVQWCVIVIVYTAGASLRPFLVNENVRPNNYTSSELDVSSYYRINVY